MDFREGHFVLIRVELADMVAQRDRGAYRALGVVLVCDRDAEDRHEAVAHHLGDRAPELLSDPLQ